VRVYRGPGRRRPRRRIAFGMVAATAAIAFVIGVVLFTGTELIAGEPIGKAGGRTTIGIGGGGNKKNTERDQQNQQNRSPSDTGERPEGQEQPSTQPEEEAPPSTTTETTPTPTLPEETTPQPTPAPQQAPAPPPTETAPAP
jgi:outer membrane biosynthesis protein TonB